MIGAAQRLNRPLEEDLPCVQCRRNLNGWLCIDDCPDCGTPVLTSMRSRYLSMCDPDWVKGLGNGAYIMALANLLPFMSMSLTTALFALGGVGSEAVGAEAMIAIDEEQIMTVQYVSMAMQVITALVMASGVWLLGAGEPTGAMAIPSRIFLLVFGFGAAMGAMFTVAGLAVGDDLVYLVGLILHICYVPLSYAAVLHCSALAAKIPEPDLAAQGRSIATHLLIATGMLFTSPVVLIMLATGGGLVLIVGAMLFIVGRFFWVTLRTMGLLLGIGLKLKDVALIAEDYRDMQLAIEQALAEEAANPTPREPEPEPEPAAPEPIVATLLDEELPIRVDVLHPANEADPLPVLATRVTHAQEARLAELRALPRKQLAVKLAQAYRGMGMQVIMAEPPDDVIFDFVTLEPGNQQVVLLNFHNRKQLNARELVEAIEPLREFEGWNGAAVVLTGVVSDMMAFRAKEQPLRFIDADALLEMLDGAKTTA